MMITGSVINAPKSKLLQNIGLDKAKSMFSPQLNGSQTGNQRKSDRE